MKLMTKPIGLALLAAAANQDVLEKLPEHQRPIIVKYFTPDAQCSWFIMDGTQEDDDWRLFGLCDLGMGTPELGYVMLSDLESIRGHLRLPVERDGHWTGTLADARRVLRSMFGDPQ